jgi:hypothetical protein
MENNELQNIWKNINSGINNTKNKKELDDILRAKVKAIFNEDQYFIAFSFAIGIGFMLFLAAVTILRRDDIYLVINNVLLALLVIYFQIMKIRKFYQLNNYQPNLSVKEWLKHRIDILSKYLYDNTVYFILPVGFILALFSVDVFMASKPFIEVIRDEKLIVGMFAGFVIGLNIAFISVKRIRKRQLGNLKDLENLYEQISD